MIAKEALYTASFTWFGQNIATLSAIPTIGLKHFDASVWAVMWKWARYANSPKIPIGMLLQGAPLAKTSGEKSVADPVIIETNAANSNLSLYGGKFHPAQICLSGEI